MLDKAFADRVICDYKVSGLSLMASACRSFAAEMSDLCRKSAAHCSFHGLVAASF
jgi:hypothetical protein